MASAEVSVGREMFVCGHHHASCDAEIMRQRSGWREHRPSRQVPLLDRRAQLLLQLGGKPPSIGPIEPDEKVRWEARIVIIGLFRNILIGS